MSRRVALPEVTASEAEGMALTSGARFLDGLSCTEAILEASCQLAGIDPRVLMPLASGFRGGMGMAGCACGALVGGTMAVGLFAGRSGENESDATALALTKRLHDEFLARFSTTCCRALNGDDFESPEHDRRCADITAETTRMTLTLLLERDESFRSAPVEG